VLLKRDWLVMLLTQNGVWAGSSEKSSLKNLSRAHKESRTRDLCSTSWGRSLRQIGAGALSIGNIILRPDERRDAHWPDQRLEMFADLAVMGAC
jgi:hypothetical protein